MLRKILLNVKNSLNDYLKNIKILINKNKDKKKGFFDIKSYKKHTLVILYDILIAILNSFNLISILNSFNLFFSVFYFFCFIKQLLISLVLYVKQNVLLVTSLIKKKCNINNLKNLWTEKNNTNKINYFFATTLFFNVEHFNLVLINLFNSLLFTFYQYFLFFKCLIGLFSNLIFVILENVPLSFIIYTAVWYYQNSLLIKLDLLFFILKLNNKLNILNLKLDEHKLCDFLWHILFKDKEKNKSTIKVTRIINNNTNSSAPEPKGKGWLAKLKKYIKEILGIIVLVLLGIFLLSNSESGPTGSGTNSGSELKNEEQLNQSKTNFKTSNNEINENNKVQEEQNNLKIKEKSLENQLNSSESNKEQENTIKNNALNIEEPLNQSQLKTEKVNITSNIEFLIKKLKGKMLNSLEENNILTLKKDQEKVKYNFSTDLSILKESLNKEYLNCIMQIKKELLTSNSFVYKLDKFNLIFRTYYEALKNDFFCKGYFEEKENIVSINYKVLFLTYGELQMPQVVNNLKIISKNNFFTLYDYLNKQKVEILGDVVNILNKNKVGDDIVKNYSNFFIDVEEKFNGNIYNALPFDIKTNLSKTSDWSDFINSCVDYLAFTERTNFYSFLLNYFQNKYDFSKINQIKDYQLFLKPFFESFNKSNEQISNKFLITNSILSFDDVNVFFKNYKFSPYMISSNKLSLSRYQENFDLFTIKFLEPKIIYSLVSVYIFSVLIGIYLKNENINISNISEVVE